MKRLLLHIAWNSEKGIAGTNVRMQPDNHSEILDVLHDDDKVLYLETGDGWIKVELQDGTEGWIREYLLENIPQY